MPILVWGIASFILFEVATTFLQIDEIDLTLSFYKKTTAQRSLR